MNYKWIALALGVVCMAAPDAQAQFGLGGYSSSFGYGCGISSGPYNLGQLPVPPYFAIHPPVYYGQRVHRTYGASPYARPSFQLAAPVAQLAPQVVNNPYAANEEQAARDAASGRQPKLVLNPYVEQPQVASAAAGPQPEVVLNPFFKPEQRVAQK